MWKRYPSPFEYYHEMQPAYSTLERSLRLKSQRWGIHSTKFSQELHLARTTWNSPLARTRQRTRGKKCLWGCWTLVWVYNTPALPTNQDPVDPSYHFKLLCILLSQKLSSPLFDFPRHFEYHLAAYSTQLSDVKGKKNISCSTGNQIY